MIHIDGSKGEGGGQVLRSSLALSLATGKPFRIDNIRAGRKKPGLMRQHLTAVEAAVEISGSEAASGGIGSRTMEFSPGVCKAGEYHFAVGTAGSATLVLQTILPSLCLAEGRSHLVLEGGTHNAWAPPFDFLQKTFLPLLSRMGPRVEVSQEKYGFYPAGGGRFQVWIEPAQRFESLELMERGEVVNRRARILSAGLPEHVGKRERKRLTGKLGWEPEWVSIEEIRDSAGPGNVVLVELECQQITEVFCGFGKRGLPAEKVADETVEQVLSYLKADVPVGKYLADQLMIPMALAGYGKFCTMQLTRHSTTNLEVINNFLDLEVNIDRQGRNLVDVEIRASS